MPHRRSIARVVAAVFVFAACAPAAPATQSPAAAAPTTLNATPAPVTAAPGTPTAAPATATAPPLSPPASPGAELCAPDEVQGALKNPGRLTLSTDNPAFPPWWGGDPATQYPGEPEGGSGWEVSDPYSGEGLEGATAYAIAEKLGFEREEVDWLQNAVFEQAFAPGPKPFDFHMAQVSIRPERAEAVDFSEPYFDSSQSLLALTPNEITSETTVSALKGYKLGAAANTTSFELIEDVIQPTVEPAVFPDNATALTALQNGQIDGLVVDLGSAFYMRDAQLEDYDTPEPEAKIVGAFAESAQVDQVGAVLEKDSPLTECVSAAILAMKADGTLDAIYGRWIETGQEIPFFEP